MSTLPPPGSFPPPASGPWGAAPLPPPAATDQLGSPVALALALAGAAALLLGSFMSWAEVVTIFGTISVNGMDGDGQITAPAGLVAVVLFAITLLRWKTPPGSGKRPSRSMLIVGTVFAGISGAIALYDFVDVSQRIAGEDFDGAATARVGVGLHLCAGGGIGALVSGITAAATLRR